MAKKTHKLRVTESYHFRLIGISSHENDYRISWIINQSMDFSLSKLENLLIHHAKLDLAQEFSHYAYYDEDTLLDYHLISNRCNDGFLLEELRNLDFILKISGDIDNHYISELVKKIRMIDMVTTAFEINPAELKSRTKLLF